MKILIYACVIAVSYTISHAADLRVADMFSSHMVLQARQPIPIWGTTKPNDTVAVRFGQTSQHTTANPDGTWRLSLSEFTASADPQIMVVTSGASKIEFTDVLVGEVWYASGQSNMDWKLKNSAKQLPEMAKLLAEANLPHIRYRAVKTKDNATPQTSIGDKASWTVCTPATAANYSAVAYVYARRLHKELGVPIGIIESAWGGHPIEPFIPETAFIGHPVLEKELELAKAHDMNGLREMIGGVFARNDSWLPGAIFNSRIAPVAPYAVRGAIWYQAESNCGKDEDPRLYNEKMKALIRGWRTAWQQPEMPVYYVQLPQYEAPGWVVMRDEQRRALTESNTGMAVIIDLAQNGIHPPNKLDVGERLALWPLAKDYDRKIPFSGPLYQRHQINGNQITISFSHAGAGLRTGSKTDLQPTALTDGKTVNGFELAATDGTWHPASATIQGTTIICTSPHVTSPKAVRYAWAPAMPTLHPWNLYNPAGLPASPFTTATE